MSNDCIYTFAHLWFCSFGENIYMSAFGEFSLIKMFLIFVFI